MVGSGNAIVGTLDDDGLAAVIAVPFGLLVAIFDVEVGDFPPRPRGS